MCLFNFHLRADLINFQGRGARLCQIKPENDPASLYRAMQDRQVGAPGGSPSLKLRRDKRFGADLAIITKKRMEIEKMDIDTRCFKNLLIIVQNRERFVACKKYDAILV